MPRPVSSSSYPSATYFEPPDQRTDASSSSIEESYAHLSETPSTREPQRASLPESPTKRLKIDNLEQLISKGYRSLKDGDLNQAIESFQEAEFSCPNDYRIHQGLAESFYSQKNFEAAITHLDQRLELHPTASAFELRAEIFRQQDQLDKALEDFTQALSADPERSFSLVGRADIFRRKEQFDDAISDLQKALQINAEDSYAWVLLSFVHLQQGFSQAALEILNHVLRKSPHNVYALYVRSKAFYKEGHHQAALDDINHALHLDPGNLIVQKRRAEMLNRLPPYYVPRLA